MVFAMKKALLTGIITMAFFAPVMAGKVDVQGWSGFEPEPQIIKAASWLLCIFYRDEDQVVIFFSIKL